MGNVLQFPRCGRNVSGWEARKLTSANTWKQYCRELDALHVTEIVQKLTGHSIGELRKDGRRPHMVDARQLFVLLCKEHTTYSYPKIAIVLNRDHTSVMHLEKRKQSDRLQMLLKAGHALADDVKERVFGPPVV